MTDELETGIAVAMGNKFWGRDEGRAAVAGIDWRSAEKTRQRTTAESGNKSSVVRRMAG